MIDWLNNHMFSCFFKSHFGIDCPGCGAQTAFIDLLRGNMLKSLSHYPPLIPLMILFVFLSVHIVMKVKNGADILKYTFIFNVFLIFINFIYKLLVCAQKIAI